MKKKLFGIITIVVIATVTGYNAYTSQSDIRLSNLALANIEALGYNNEVDAYKCSVELTCCGIASNKKVSCQGDSKCESLKDGWGYVCKGVKCDGKETLC